MNTKSFTLIEILVALVILGILSTFIIVSLNSVVDSANDAKRKKDLDSISKMLMTYRILNGSYPDKSGNIETALSDLIPDYTTSFPKDPSGSSYNYFSDGTTYTITATLSNGEELTYNPETGFVQGEGGGGGESWLSGYGFRKPITVSSSAELTDYQVKVDVVYDSDMQSDFRDLRFTSSDKETELSYWIETINTGVSAVAWIKVDSLSIGDNTIYMYYGNNDPLLVSTSSGESTFLFFDHFEGSSINNSKWGGHLDHISLSNSIISLTHDSGIKSLPALSFTRPLILESRFKSGSNSYRTWVSLSNDSLSTTIGFDWKLLSSTCYSRGTNYVAIGTGYTDWNRYTIKWTTTNVLNYINGNLVQNHSGSPSENLEINVWAWTSGANPQIDWVAIRKYTATEPIYSIGDEEFF